MSGNSTEPVALTVRVWGLVLLARAVGPADAFPPPHPSGRENFDGGCEKEILWSRKH